MSQHSVTPESFRSAEARFTIPCGLTNFKRKGIEKKKMTPRMKTKTKTKAPFQSWLLSAVRCRSGSHARGCPVYVTRRPSRPAPGQSPHTEWPPRSQTSQCQFFPPGACTARSLPRFYLFTCLKIKTLS